MKNEDLKIECYENSSPEVTIRITHIPTGRTVSGKGIRRFVLKNELLNELRDLVKKDSVIERLKGVPFGNRCLSDK